MLCLCVFICLIRWRGNIIDVFAEHKMDQKWKSRKSSNLSFIICWQTNSISKILAQVNDVEVLDPKGHSEISYFLQPKQSVLPTNIPFDMWI